MHWGMMELSDGVVRLTRFERGDAPVLCAGDYDPEHRLRFEFPQNFVPSLQHSESVVARWEQEAVAGTRFTLAVRDARTGELLGGCELRPHGDGVADLSYWTHPAHRRGGVASRALALLCRLAFERHGYLRLEAAVDPDNIASHRVAARCGFKAVGERQGRVLHVLEGKHGALGDLHGT